MSRPAKSHFDTVYPPRGMRLDRAAAYLDISESSFLRLVTEKELPPGIQIRGMTVWDRHELDAAFENWKAKRQGKRNTVAEALGIEDHSS
jgi:predicted DNA-binding transcriptional regulator AlpA